MDENLWFIVGIPVLLVSFALNIWAVRTLRNAGRSLPPAIPMPEDIEKMPVSGQRQMRLSIVGICIAVSCICIADLAGISSFSDKSQAMVGLIFSGAILLRYAFHWAQRPTQTK